jgi:hypothetical protein
MIPNLVLTCSGRIDNALQKQNPRDRSRGFGFSATACDMDRKNPGYFAKPVVAVKAGSNPADTPLRTHFIETPYSCVSSSAHLSMDCNLRRNEPGYRMRTPTQVALDR